MTGAQLTALRRLLLMVLAWAATEALLLALGLAGISTIAGAAAAVGVYLLTRGVTFGRRRRRGDVIYWRGRQIDRSEWD